MALNSFEKLYEGDDLDGATLDVMYLRSPGGTLKNVYLYAGGNVVGADAVFNLTKNGAALWSGADRLVIPQDSASGEKTDLSVETTRGDIFFLDLEESGESGISAPLTLILEFDDGTTGGLSVEEVQDIVGAMLVAGSHSMITYDDEAGTVTVGSIQLSDEEIQDKVGAFISGGANTTVTYNDGANTLTIAETTAGKTQEEIEDIVANLLQQGANITLTYNDAGNALTIAASGGGGSGGGVPAGGTTEQILAKVDGTDYNTHWVAKPSGGGGASGFQKITWTNKINVSEDSHKVLTKTSAGLAWDAGASSLETFKTGIIRFRLKYSDYRVIGFSETDTGAGFADSIKYCLFISGTGYTLYKNGAATSVSGSVSGSGGVFNIFDFEILEDENGTHRVVYLYLNKTLIFQELYDGNATDTLVVDTSFATEGANMGAPMLFKYT